MQPLTICYLDTIFANVVSISISLVGIAFIFALLVGSFQFLTAAGDKEATSRAQKTINYALRGLVLAVGSWIVLRLVGLFVGADLSVFSVCPGVK